MNGTGQPLISVIVPTRGEETKLSSIITALEAQTLKRERYEVLISFDGVRPSDGLAAELGRHRFQTIVNPARAGPGAARNRAALHARGAYVAFTEDDCMPASDWLERAAARLDREPSIDVLVGETLLPDGTPARRPDRDQPHYLPTNLIVKRSIFESVGGYDERYFDPSSGIYFREDSDLGFSLEKVNAKVALESSSRVVHPREHPRYLDPIRWARRYRMDALLQSRHPERFRERIEVHRIGPFTIRRPFVRACFGVVIASVAVGTALVASEAGLASLFGAVALLSFLPVWAKWRFDPVRLPVVFLVPFVLVYHLLLGRAARPGASRPSSTERTLNP